jgi:16S rRNA (cytosine1402-N4)-methyltransferase
MDKQPHITVLLEEATDALRVHENGIYIDATLGAGGHSRRILELGGAVMGIDQDESSLELVRQTLSNPKLTTLYGNFSELSTLVKAQGIEAVDGVLFDLGVSSMQLDEADRGFSFMKDAPLDMRMSKGLAVTARDLVNALGRKELYELFTKYAQEHRARPIAEAIISARRLKPIETTRELATIIERASGGRRGHIHPATKVFQALRMAVNDELNSLKDALPQALAMVKKGGRLVVISFHEGEDRIVKQFLKAEEEVGSMRMVTDKPIIPTEREIHSNPRARSAKLRIAEKI